MRLEGKQIQFVVPFFSFTSVRAIRFGGKRCSIQLQETALVVEGELLRFTFIVGLEWLFRRALSEWSTVTVPYSRIESVRMTGKWALRVALVAAIAAFVGLSCLTWSMEEVFTVVLVAGVPLIFLLAYVNVRVKPSVRIVFRGKDGKCRRLAFVIRKKPIRNPFIEAVRKHQADAARFATPRIGAA